MANLEALYGLVGVLGGASIGGLSTGLLQRAAYKRDVQRAELERGTQARATKQEQQSRVKERALEAVAAARSSTRAWAQYMEYVLQNLTAGEPVDRASFDAEVSGFLTAAGSAYYGLAATEGIELVEHHNPGDEMMSMTEISANVRLVLLQPLLQGRNPVLERLLRQIQMTSAGINATMVRQTEVLTGRGSDVPRAVARPANASLPNYLAAPPCVDFGPPRPSVFTATNELGDVVERPEPLKIAAMLIELRRSGLRRGNAYLNVVKPDDDCPNDPSIRVVLWHDSSYQLSYFDGAWGSRKTRIVSKEQVLEVLLAWVTDRPDWQDGLVWSDGSS
ncbi:hypothetical protein OTB20_41070 [Streptomyces sp. H27-H1]|uniref:hypothetical protein n=1 Tax=Streptomyces sp. H27-H1 TaxID=2996461 RepID=UPI002271EC45|nr:hypothetical protein [Streptomyces sp. H27-H1]MCY0932429.1 hypothetical protein [Streptomyces sp. H27-H1]